MSLSINSHRAKVTSLSVKCTLIILNDSYVPRNYSNKTGITNTIFKYIFRDLDILCVSLFVYCRLRDAVKSKCGNLSLGP